MRREAAALAVANMAAYEQLEVAEVEADMERSEHIITEAAR